ncbi:hypothetical protein E2562_028601 [Oryza meyeriana var. granulata]|uniref:Uncharacterized protein n=1 Tax=Oryza meyeriana var. granulata TaxID=110450 RepID=A0A6G1D8S7_9ORYZ|nr:hypothetical protein E2562_028601 [Oryza meyeriana var. granulata]
MDVNDRCDERPWRAGRVEAVSELEIQRSPCAQALAYPCLKLLPTLAQALADGNGRTPAAAKPWCDAELTKVLVGPHGTQWGQR